MIRYPVLIEEGSDAAAFGVAVPDLPGCFSAGDTLDEAMDAAREAIAAWVDAALDGGQPPDGVETRRIGGCRDTRARPWRVVEVDPAVFDDMIERVNITLPKRVLRRLDDLAGARRQSRGAFIAELTMRTPDGGRGSGS